MPEQAWGAASVFLQPAGPKCCRFSDRPANLAQHDTQIAARSPMAAALPLLLQAVQAARFYSDSKTLV